MFALRQSISTLSRHFGARSTSFAVQSKAYADAAEAPDPLSTEEGSATWAQIQDYIKDATPEEKEMAEWVPVPEPFCPKTYFYNMKRYLACRSAGFQPQEVAQAWNDYDVSVGAYSLEWVLPSPPPIHTFEEPPLIKEAPEYSQ